MLHYISMWYLPYDKKLSLFVVVICISGNNNSYLFVTNYFSWSLIIHDNYNKKELTLQYGELDNVNIKHEFMATFLAQISNNSVKLLLFLRTRNTLPTHTDSVHLITCSTNCYILARREPMKGLTFHSS